MQTHMPLNWDDLRVVLAVARGETLSAAAKRLGVDQTTVTRRLATLEQAVGTPLFQRIERRLRPTDAGADAVAHAERVEAEIERLAARLAGADRAPEGDVRLTAVPILVNRVLIPHLGTFRQRYPRLSLELVAEPRNLQLAKRDADIAVRLARPAGGTALCRKLGELAYSVYGAVVAGGPLPWLGYDDDHADLPQARWLAREARNADIALRANDAETLFQAVVAGLGRTLLPDLAVTDGDGLTRLTDGPVLRREVWLLVHPEIRHLPRISAVADWLTALFADPATTASA